MENGNIDKKDINKVYKKLSFYERLIKAIQSDVNIDPSRLIGLTDGIFGMVMTLLIFSISLPEIEMKAYADFITYIANLLPSIGITIISFILLATFWIFHHEFLKIKSLDMPYLWLSVLFLISISFLPFSTSLIGHYAEFFLSEEIFGLNIFITLILFFLMHHYAFKREFLISMDMKEKKYTNNTLLLMMILTMIINLLDYNVSLIFIYLFLLVPVILTIRNISYKMKIV